MEVYYDLRDLPRFKNAVLTIGSFDGVHSGHQKILERLNQLARQVEGESIVITFHPHPRLVVYPKDNSLKLISTIEEKVALLKNYGIDNVVVVPFTIEFSQQSPDEYIQKFLVEKFNPRYIVIGYDHRFGLHRQGNIDYLRVASVEFDFDVIEIQKQEIEHIAISSTKVRTALDRGDVRTANQLLGHYFTLSGKVVQGQRIGNTIGFPTANVEIEEKHKLVPPHGIYAVYFCCEGERYRAMLYIGNRPVLKEHHNRTIEVNIFDFNQDIYGKNVQIELVEFIREDAQIDQLEVLQELLTQDKQKSLGILLKEETLLSKKKRPHRFRRPLS